MKQTYYALYDKEDYLLFVGTIKECAQFMGTTENSFMSCISKLNRGIHKSLKRGYMAYKIEEEDDYR